MMTMTMEMEMTSEFLRKKVKMSDYEIEYNWNASFYKESDEDDEDEEEDDVCFDEIVFTDRVFDDLFCEDSDCVEISGESIKKIDLEGIINTDIIDVNKIQIMEFGDGVRGVVVRG